MSAERAWYAGLIARRSGARALVDVVASRGEAGWEAVPAPRKLFPKTGQVELQGPPALEAAGGEWIAFQASNDGRPGARQARIGAHRFLPRHADLRSLGTVEAARFLFTREGWPDATDPGHWAVRFAEDRILALQLERGRDGRLRCTERSLGRIGCLPYDADRVVAEPTGAAGRTLYDAGDEPVLAVHDWSPGADYVAHVVRALAGADDPRLPELITWLELHRDEESGRVSAIGTGHELAFEALRSGELAARLSADREVMSAYLAAVREDPLVAAALKKAAEREATAARSDARAAAEEELAAELEVRRSEAAAARAEHEARQEAELAAALAERERELWAALERRVEASTAEAEAESRERGARAAAALDAARAELSALQSGRDTLAKEIDTLRAEAVRQTEAASAAAERAAAAETGLAAAMGRHASAGRPLATVARTAVQEVPNIDRAELGRRIATCVLLTAAGRTMMADLAAHMLAGEVPILDGPQVEDFSLVAEALLAADRLVPFDADATVITPDDIWSRPGSGLASQVSQAAALAAEGHTHLVQLRGIDRSAASAWHPGLASLARRGLLPRPLLLFATLANPASEEATALPAGTCRLTIDSAIVEGAALVAPGLLGGAASVLAGRLDPAGRPSDLSVAMAVLPALAEQRVELDLTTAIRIARVVTEAAALAGGDTALSGQVAQRFCRSIRRGDEGPDTIGGKSA